jgi:molybdenum cofactor guanylyltransferase
MKVSALLLVGGKSSRMGQDKATMLFRGEPLWKTQLEHLRRLRPKEILISAQTDPAWRPSDTEFVADQQPSRGPLSGIAAALSRIKTDHLLVLAIDTPFLPGAYLRTLRAGIQSGQGVVPINGYRAEPLVAVYPRDATLEFEQALTGDNFSLQPVVRKLIKLGKLRQLDVSPEEASFFRNLNEPADVPTD